MQNFDPKKPGETLNIGFDFSNSLSPLETLVSANLSVAILRGIDASPMAILQGSPVIIGGLVSQFITGGLSDVVYIITCTATTNDSQVLIDEGVIRVVNNRQTSALFMRVVDVYGFRANELAIASSGYDQLSNLSDDVVWDNLVGAEQDLQRRLGIPLQPSYIFDHPPTQDEIAALNGMPYQFEDGATMPENFFSVTKFGCFRTRVFPIIEIKSIKLIYPNQLGFSFTVPDNWIRIDNKYGIIHIFPSATSVTMPVSMFMMQAVTCGMEVPCMIRTEYIAGIDATDGNYQDIVNLAKRMATLRILKASYLSSGDSLSVDGLSQTSTGDLAIMQTNVDKEVDNLRERLRGILYDIL